MGTFVDDELYLHDDGLVLLVVVKRIVDGDDDDSGGELDFFAGATEVVLRTC